MKSSNDLYYYVDMSAEDKAQEEALERAAEVIYTGVDKEATREIIGRLLSLLSDAYDAHEVEMWLLYLLEGIDNLYGEDVLRPLADDLSERLDAGEW